MLVGQLTPLHCATELPFTLPSEGFVTIGRRPENTVVCADVAVSGTHCLIHCAPHGQVGSFEVEDASTNGTYVNDMRLSRGQKLALSNGDVIALTKPPALEDLHGAAAASGQTRVQFKLQICRAEQNLQSKAFAAAQERFLPTPLDEPKGVDKVCLSRLPSLSAQTAEVLATDMLQKAQQSNAKITSELLLVQRRWDEERKKVRRLDQEIRKAWSARDEESTRRVAMQSTSESLQQEVTLLRADLERATEWERSSREALEEVLAQQAELELKMSQYRLAAAALARTKQQNEEKLQAVAERCKKVCSIAARVAEAVASPAAHSNNKSAEGLQMGLDKGPHEPPSPCPTGKPRTVLSPSRIEPEACGDTPNEARAAERLEADNKQALARAKNAPEVADCVKPAETDRDVHAALDAALPPAPSTPIQGVEQRVSPSEAEVYLYPLTTPATATSGPAAARDSAGCPPEQGNTARDLESLLATVGGCDRNPFQDDAFDQGVKRSGTASVLVLPSAQLGPPTAKRLRLNAA
mmetsp:Transcript_20750/g.37752  ORF Transcript_20750/g.37752 Transcript_20750/m.37752 type:complete len:525 (+) Transcript_20750:76-1650(+)